MATRDVPADVGRQTDQESSVCVGDRSPNSGGTRTPRAPHSPEPRGCRAATSDAGLLWDRLDASTQRAVTMVVAPAGAGKTLGVAGWLQHSPLGQDATWISGNNLVSLRGWRPPCARRAAMRTSRGSW